MRNRLKFTFQFGIEKLTGHSIEHINSYSDFVRFMYTPVDGSSLAMGRIMFGLKNWTERKNPLEPVAMNFSDFLKDLCGFRSQSHDIKWNKLKFSLT